MKKKEIATQQYSFETKNLEGASDDFLEKTAPLIGYIVHRFNTLEETLNDAICDIFHDDCHTTGLLVICKMNYSQKVDLFKRIWQTHQNLIQKKLPVFEELTNNLTKAGELRNQVVHADWESAYDDGYTRCKLKVNAKGMQHEYIQFSPEALEEILELIDKTYDLFDQYEDELQSFW
ncbi:MAG: hypothetical protein ABII94_03450 [Patescibacteria group bacterium]